MKLSQIFKLTKDHLWDGQVPKTGSPYICDTIKHLSSKWNMDIPFDDTARARAAVASLLNGQFGLCDWLLNRGYVTLNENRSLRDSERMAGTEVMVKLQATRHAWLDHLIAHYEALGD
jgi:hypothetical protein